jgi:hypothetical protein
MSSCRSSLSAWLLSLEGQVRCYADQHDPADSIKLAGRVQQEERTGKHENGGLNSA